jgi:predicted DCC family thiol-disulfide oxidoreductase YuxK
MGDPDTPRRTRPPPRGVATVIYDGRCTFCSTEAERLAGRARGRLRLRSFRTAGSLADFPGLTPEDCSRELKLIDGQGRVFGGAEAVVRVLALGHPRFGKIGFLYYVPGIRWLCDRIYAWVARHRYRIHNQ